MQQPAFWIHYRSHEARKFAKVRLAKALEQLTPTLKALWIKGPDDGEQQEVSVNNRGWHVRCSKHAR